MDPAVRALIDAVHASGRQCVVAVTGGGHGAITALLNVPGASRTLLEAIVPYGEQALVDFLGRRPEHFCTAETARQMARRAYTRATWLSSNHDLVGVGCTASLTTDRPKRGEHRMHVAVRTLLCTVTTSLVLAKDARDREGEETIVDTVLLNALAETCGLAQRLVPPLLSGEVIERETVAENDPIARVCAGDLANVLMDIDGRLKVDAALPEVLLPGAFNPAHDGHWGLAQVAGRLRGKSVAFELSVANVDKPTLHAQEVRRRLAQFAWRSPVWITHAPTYVEKSSLFPGCVFAIGMDTAARIVDPRYYHDSASERDAGLTAIREQNGRFLVAGRVDAQRRFATLADLSLPPTARGLFESIPEGDFRTDCSSTAIRQRGVAGPEKEG